MNKSRLLVNRTPRGVKDISDRESEKFPRLAEGIEKKLIAFASLCGTARRSYYIAGNDSNDRGRLRGFHAGNRKTLLMAIAMIPAASSADGVSPFPSKKDLVEPREKVD
ncbi:hypothetical protein HZH66_005482 [Vespula vulgaris]|uniref:Uncharacterized protein n=1 Tax=Vespula vulgaris TaxID=7454 RepID=A0A834K4W5_VESVU|nr:hypothetical protein HZH66_005482 [Vespula vulgaris]